MSLSRGFCSWSAHLYVEFLNSDRIHDLAKLRVEWWVERESGNRFQIVQPHSSVSVLEHQFWMPEIVPVEFTGDRIGRELTWGFSWSVVCPGFVVGSSQGGGLNSSSTTGMGATGGVAPGGVGGQVNINTAETTGSSQTFGRTLTPSAARVESMLVQRFYRFEAHHHQTLYTANRNDILALSRLDQDNNLRAVSYSIATEQMSAIVERPYRPQLRRRPQGRLPSCCDPRVIVCGEHLQSRLMCRDN